MASKGTVSSIGGLTGVGESIAAFSRKNRYTPGAVASGFVWLRATFDDRDGENRELSVKCLIGPEAIRPIAGYARWNEITRPKKKSLIEWTGVDPIKVQITLMVDYFDENDGLSCEKDIRELELMAGATERDQRPAKPPHIRWTANALHDYSAATHIDWVMESLEWTNFMWNRQGPNIVRAEARVVLAEDVPDEYLTTGAKKNKAKKKKKQLGPSKANSYRVTLADTQKQGLKTIAAKRLGDMNRWREIGNLQKPVIRDPMNIEVDQILKMPKK